VISFYYKVECFSLTREFSIIGIIYYIIFFCKVDIIFFCISYLEKFNKYTDFLRVNMQENMRCKVGYVIRRKTTDIMHI
jgi:hypothetical protein